jgi:trehalose-6-phosphate synthase
MWTREDLHQLVEQKLGGYLFVVVSNREPYIHRYSGEEIGCEMPASGLTTALDPVVRACSGTWVAHGSGDADREVVDAGDRVRVPPENPKYSLRRVWLSKAEEDGYYYGLSNEALWPLCHVSYTRPVFDENDWETYRKVNRLFADAVLEEVGDKRAFVFVQDYQLALLPRFLREANPNLFIAQFWHIPWPNPEAFRICPWQEEILDGLLGNHLLVFHIRHHCNNFMDTVDGAIESRSDRGSFQVIRAGKRTNIRFYPISIDFDSVCRLAQSRKVAAESQRLKKRLGLRDEIVGMGLDRIDYTKGIPDRLRALDLFLVKYPEYKGKLVFVQAGVPSRVHIGTYRDLNDEVDELIEEINWRHGSGHWRPIIDFRGHHSQTTLMALRRLSDFCVVSALHDGMNLVAKEYVASSFDDKGVLILSRFTGSARELTDAVLVNPYAIDEFVEAIKKAIEMPSSERRRRMRKMRRVVEENNVYKWAADIISEMVGLEFGG